MAEAVIAAKSPVALELAPGVYYWCSCGRSQQQPFCDGSHEGTEFSPLEIRVDQPKRVSLCRCKRTASPPYCDGTHKKLG